MVESFLILYHNPRCLKSREAKIELEKRGIKFVVFEYLKEALTKRDIIDILHFGNYQIKDILRKNEREYKEFIQNKKLNKDELIDLIVRYPRLLQRPIVLDRKKRFALILRDKESLERIK